MIKEVDSTISLFSEAEDIHTVSHETWDKFECKSTIILKRIPKVEDLIRVLPLISNRDSWRFIIESEYGEAIFDINSKDGSIENEAIKDDLIQIYFTRF
mgnify:CR=1 FL=1